MPSSLRDFGIRLKRETPGNHKALCPQCSASRKKKKDPCLSVCIGPATDSSGKPVVEGNAIWLCHNCNWSGTTAEGTQNSGSVFYRSDFGEPKAVYYYTPDFVIARYIDRNGEKQPRPWRRADGVWESKRPEGQPPLYNQATLEWSPSSPVIVVEGEKAADAATEFFEGYVTVTWPFGAKYADKVDWSKLKGRDVYLLPDHDDEGMMAMRMVHDHLRGVAAKVTWIKPEETRPKSWDIADWREADGDPKAWFSDQIEIAESTVDRPRTTFFTPETLKRMPPPEWQVEDIVVKGGVTLFFGPPKSGKTHVATDLAYSMARGIPFFGKKVQQSGVLLVIGEGVSAVALRLRAYEQFHNVNLNDFAIGYETDRLPFFPSEEATGSVDAILRSFEKIPGCGAIVLDPWVKFLGMGDENSSQDVMTALNAISYLKERTGASINIVHHTPVGNTARPRGHGALLGEVDIAASIVKTNGHRIFQITDSRHSAEGDPIAFRLITEMMGEHSACVVEMDDSGMQVSGDNFNWTPNRIILMEILDKIYNNAMLDGTLTRCPKTGTLGVKISLIRDTALSRFRDGGTDDRDTARRKYNRTLEDLQAAGKIDKMDDLIWPKRTNRDTDRDTTGTLF